MVFALIAALCLGLVAAGRLARLERMRLLTVPLLLTAASCLAYWTAAALAEGSQWTEWLRLVLLLSIGYLVVRAVLLVAFEWLLVERLGVEMPRLARDVVALIIYMVMAAVVLQTALGVKVGALLATSAVLTVVIGLALQETLGTLLAGLAIAWEKRIQAGVWLEIDGQVGRVEELGWRSLVLRTRLGERVLIPNSQVTRARVRVLGRGQRPVAVPVRLSVAYEVAPDRVKGVLAQVAAGIPNTVPRPAPQILTLEFADSGIVYEVRLWTLKPWFDFDLTDQFLTRAHAALGRAAMEIPFPQRTVHMAPERTLEDTAARCLEALAACPVFNALPEAALEALAGRSRWLRFAPDEPVVSVGEASRAMYVVATGEAVVEGFGRELGRLGPGDEFGEIAFLTGAERAATVRALGVLQVVEVASDALSGALEAHAEVADELARLMASRQQVLEDMAEVTQELRRPGSLVDLLRDRLKRLVRDD